MPLVHPVKTINSKSLLHAKERVIQSFRDWLNAAPAIVENYNLDISTPQVRQRIREEFEKYRYVNDIRVIDRLLFKSRTEYEETINMWKQKTHVMRYFNDNSYEVPKSNNFLDNFYEGRKHLRS
ncbi:hypothetical protein HDU92_005433 [Lobulomyces angularis]|nr:hypothetical protein HDU92_005433 [Lobulomyces angularis]